LRIRKVGKSLGLEFGKLFPQQLNLFSLLLGSVKQLPIDRNLLELLLGFLISLPVLPNHHLLYLLSLLHRGLQIPLLSLELLVFLSDGLYLEPYLFDFLLEVGDPLLTLLPDLLHLLFQGLYLVFVHFGVLFG
jgi:hypothetical protein